MPEIDIRGNGISIADGDNTPSTADWTDMGSRTADGGSLTTIFVIHNTGTATLNITGLGLSQDVHYQSGSPAAIWGIIPGPMTIASGDSTTMGVEVYISLAGTYTTTLIIESDDSDEGYYTFDVRGTGTEAEEDEYDFGDAPDPTYSTLLASDGARHVIDPDVFLGILIDAETDGIPDAGAQGDDNDGTDDEDGVSFTSSLVAGSTATLDVTASTDGLLSAWIDFDQDGTWDLSGDSIFFGKPLTAGTNQLTFTVPGSAVAGATYARFRFTTISSVDPGGSAPDGEVEDYAVEIEEGDVDSYDYGDAPAAYPDAVHTIGAVWLGDKSDSADADTGTQADAHARGDDDDGNDDEDGFTVLNGGVLVKHATNWSSIRLDFTMDPSVEPDLTLASWIDYNRDGDWDDTDEFLGSSGFGIYVPHAPITSGIVMYRNVPTHAQTGTTFVRVRAYAARNPTLSPTGAGGIGEVSDFEVVIEDEGSTTEPDGGMVWGTKWNDINGDGSWDSDESPLSGWRIWLDANQDGVEGAGDRYDTTDVNGEFQFTGLAVGAYIVGEKSTSGWAQTYPSNPSTHTVTVDTNYASRGVLFGNVEVEEEDEYDMGDAPDPTYPTLLASNGARHVIDPDVYLGSLIDAESDGIPDAGAQGDDNDGSDDEDGVVFVTSLIPDSIATVNVTASISGKLFGWIDFDQNGTWDMPGEYIFSGQWLSAGTNVLGIAVPADAMPGATYARFRFTRDAIVDPEGFAPDGEVEDYAVEIEEAAVDSFDYGDAPDPTYPTLLASDGARHRFDQDVFLGSSIDIETDGIPDAGAQGDDNNGGDDEDGVTFTSSLFADSTVNVTVTASTNGQLFAWIDFDQNGTWDMPADNIFTGTALSAGTNALTFTVPGNAIAGATYARFRFTTDTLAVDPQGSAPDGEVEDYTVEIEEAPVDTLDFGDAPHPTFPTMLSMNGARHTVDPSFYLGAAVDAESDGLPNSVAGGDDNHGVDDEDGVSLPVSLTPGAGANVDVTASADGYLNAWIDWNGNGDWSDAGDQVFSGTALTAGINTLNFTVSAGAANGSSIFARFRFSSTENLSYDGYAADGEVEDYLVWIDDDGEFDYGDAPDPTYPTVGASNGAYHAIDPEIYLGQLIDSEADGQPTSDATGDDSTGSADDDGIVISSFTATAGNSVGASATASVDSGYLNGWLDFNRDGDWLDAGEQIYTDELLLAGTNVVPFAVPATVQAGDTYARFRFSMQRGVGMTGFAPDGEVEDYMVTIEEAQDDDMYDFGDAPDPTYPTLLANDGARHVIDEDVFLGTLIDAESDGIPDAGAQGDDNSGSDDEDGVVFTTQPIVDSTAVITVIASTNGYLSAWIDFDQNGTWDMPADNILSGRALTAGTNQLTVSVPGDALPGATYARFRFTTDTTAVDPQGSAPDGEVEDYAIEIGEKIVDTQQYDWGDAPAPFPTTRSANGAYHAVDTTITWGASVDADTNGQPHAQALGDDNDGTDDEEGSIGFAAETFFFNQGLTIAPWSAIKLGFWIDWERDSSWANTNNGFALTYANETPYETTVGFGMTMLNVDIEPGIYNVRVRCYQDTSYVASYTGYGGIGEVEDYQAEYIDQVVQFDYGDAPLPYPTQIQTGNEPDDAWRHPIDENVYLGESVDGESDGQPSEDATGDGSDGNSDDDGVVLTSQLVTGDTTTVQVTASVAGYLNGFIDFNQDGDWDDDEDQIFTEEPLDSGVNNLAFAVPADAQTGDTYARFRFSTARLFRSIQRENAWHAKDGELEDYEFTVRPTDDGNEEPDDSVSAFKLYANFPNPFIAKTKISYALPRETNMTLEIYNVQGEVVRILVDGVEEAGLREVSWDGENSSGNEVVSGLYFCKMKTANYEETIRMLFLR